MIESAFPRQLHPYWPRLQESTRNWLLEKRLMPADKVERYADGLLYTDLVAGYYLGASDEVLSAISDFTAWFFAWDDRQDRDVVHGRESAWLRLCVRLQSALESPEEYMHHRDPLVAGFADSVSRIYGWLGPIWNARFARHFHRTIDACDQEFINRTTRTVPEPGAYLELRRLTFGHWIWTDLLELVARCELPDEVRKHGAFRQAALATQDFAAWYNDLCSLPKEYAGGEIHNLGIVLIRHEGLSVEEATAEVRRRAGRCVTEFLEAERAVLLLADEAADGTFRGAELSAALKSCVGNMRNWFSSVYWWHHESGRYRVDSWDDPSTPPYVSDGPAAHEEG
ncbi:terpene synthase family protein [Streptomyces sp. GC420]|uniref:terpene synthase family protein n=1 Tax=Streptomyces sp. GC420 TaxID=2697568 RepID=UPI001414F223|nr:multidrug MFS transporter [Streptomyces sp. GC420]